MDLGRSLRKAGNDCRDALDRLVQETSHRGLAWPSELRTRFEIWAKEALIYNDGERALDHQIRKNPIVRAMVWQLTEAIRANAEAYVIDSKRRNDNTPQPLAHIIEVNENDTQGLNVETPSLHGRAREGELLDDHEVIVRINDGIARLVRLSRRMRQHIREKLDVKADSFDPPDEHGKALNREFCEHLDWTLSQHPECYIENPIVRERLRHTMLLRWRRVVFHSQRAKDKTLELCKPAFPNVLRKQGLPVLDRPVLSHRPRHLTDEGQGGEQPLHKKQNIGLTAPKSLQSAGMTIGSSLKLNEENYSIAPSRRTKSLVGLRQSDFPTAPAIVEELSGFICSLCGSQQPATERESKAWRLHVLRDLAPYICLYDRCETPNARYRTTKEWLAHMDQMHQERTWLCQTCGCKFEDQRLFEQHFDRPIFHDPPVRLSFEDITLLVRLNAVPDKFPRCLFCNMDTQDVEGDVRLHMAEHLRHFALMSIPWHVLTVESSHTDSRSALAGAQSNADNSSIDRMERYIDEVSISFEAENDGGVDMSDQGTESLAHITDRPQLSNDERNDRVSCWLTDLEGEGQDPHSSHNIDGASTGFKLEPPALSRDDSDSKATRDNLELTNAVNERRIPEKPRFKHNFPWTSERRNAM